MWTRGKDAQQPGKFAFSLYAPDGALVETRGGYDTAQEADRAAEFAQRAYLFPPKLTDADMAEIEAMLAELDA